LSTWAYTIIVTTALACPRRPATAIIGTRWAISQVAWGVAQVVEVQPAVLGPQVGQLGLGQGPLPNAHEVAVHQGPSRTSRATRAREDAVVGAAADQLSVGQERLDGLLVEGDDPLAGFGLGALLDSAAGPAGVADRAGDSQPPRPAYGTVVQGLVEAGVVPAQGGQLAPAHPGQRRHQDQGAVAGVDRLDEAVELLAQQPDLPAGDWLVAGGGGAAGATLAQQGRAGQVVVVDRCVEDGAQQRQVGVHRPGCETFGDHCRLPLPDRGRVELSERDVTEGGQDALFDLLAGAVLGAWVLVLPGWPPLGGHILAEQGPGPSRFRSAGAGACSRWRRSSARFSACARRSVRKIPAERCRLPSW
jgi:hypothetical protein